MVQRTDPLRRRHGQACDSEIRRAGCPVDRRRGRDQQLHREIHNHQFGPVGPARPAPHAVLSHPAPFARLPRSETDGRSGQPPDQRHRCDSGFHCLRVVGGANQQPNPRRHGSHHVLPELAVHADCAFRGAAAIRGRLQLHPPHQKGYARSAAEGRRDRVGHPGGLILHARGEGFRARRIRTTAHGGGEPGIHRDRAAGPRHEGEAFTDGGYDHRGGNLPRTVVRGANGFDRFPERGLAGSLHLVPGQNVQTDAGTVEDDGRVLESRGGLRADPRAARH